MVEVHFFLSEMAYIYNPVKHTARYVSAPEEIAKRLTSLKKERVLPALFIGGNVSADHAAMFSEVISKTSKLAVDVECGVHTIRAVTVALECDGCAIEEIVLQQQDDPQYDEWFARAFAKNTSLQKITAAGARMANCAANSMTATQLDVYRPKAPIDSAELFWERIAAMPALCKFNAVLKGAAPFELFYKAWPGRCRTRHLDNLVTCERIVPQPAPASKEPPAQKRAAPEVPPPRRASKRIRAQRGELE